MGITKNKKQVSFWLDLELDRKLEELSLKYGKGFKAKLFNQGLKIAIDNYYKEINKENPEKEVIQDETEKYSVEMSA